MVLGVLPSGGHSWNDVRSCWPVTDRCRRSKSPLPGPLRVPAAGPRSPPQTLMPLALLTRPGRSPSPGAARDRLLHPRLSPALAQAGKIPQEHAWASAAGRGWSPLGAWGPRQPRFLRHWGPHPHPRVYTALGLGGAPGTLPAPCQQGEAGRGWGRDRALPTLPQPPVPWSNVGHRHRCGPQGLGLTGEGLTVATALPPPGREATGWPGPSPSGTSQVRPGGLPAGGAAPRALVPTPTSAHPTAAHHPKLKARPESSWRPGEAPPPRGESRPCGCGALRRPLPVGVGSAPWGPSPLRSPRGWLGAPSPTSQRGPARPRTALARTRPGLPGGGGTPSSRAAPGRDSSAPGIPPRPLT